MKKMPAFNFLAGLTISILLSVAIYFSWEWLTLWKYPLYIKITILALTFFIVIAAKFISPILGKLDSRLYLLILATIFVISRLFWLATIPTLPISDFATYDSLARAIASGNTLTSNMIKDINGLGFPLFLGLIYKLFGVRLLYAKLANLIFGILTIPFLYQIGNKIGGPIVARWVSLLFLLWPVQLMYTSVLATEHLTLFLTMLGLNSLLDLVNQPTSIIRNSVTAGISLGLGFITRPTIIIYIVVGILGLLIFRRPFRQTAYRSSLLLLFFALTYGFFLSSFFVAYKIIPDTGRSLSTNVFYGTNATSNGMWSEEDTITIQKWPQDHILEYALSASLQRLSSYTPYQIFILFFQKMRIFWAEPYYGTYWSTLSLGTARIQVVIPRNDLDMSQYIFQFGLFIASIFGCFQLIFKGHRSGDWIILCILLLGTVFHVIMVTDSRYQYVFEPVLFFLSGIGIYSKWPLITTGNDFQFLSRKA